MTFLRKRGTAWLPDARRGADRVGEADRVTGPRGLVSLSCTLGRTRAGGSDDITGQTHTHTHTLTHARSHLHAVAFILLRSRALPPSLFLFFSILGSGARNNPVYFPLHSIQAPSLASIRAGSEAKQTKNTRHELDCLLSTLVNVRGTAARAPSFCVYHLSDFPFAFPIMKTR